MELQSHPDHVGVATGDPRNAGPIAYFAPMPATREALTERLAPYFVGRPLELEARVEEVVQRIASGRLRPNPPLSQPLEAAPDPWFGLGVHPDLIEQLWRLDEAMPERCRWLVWGGPALVHPRTGAIFARGVGTIGLAMRLPAGIRAAATPDEAAVVIERRPSPPFDLGAAGPEWRWLGPKAPMENWTLAAHDFAGEPEPRPPIGRT